MILLVVLLAACSAPEQRADPPPSASYEYGDFRAPPPPQAQPFVPPPAEPEKPPAKDCEALCATLNDLNEECASWTVSCQRISKDLGKNNDTCREKNRICSQADRALAKVEGCLCR